MTPFVTGDPLADFTNWMYGFLLYGVGAFGIVFLIVILIQQELVQAYRGPAHSERDALVDSMTIVPLLIAFLIIAAAHMLRIMGWL